MNVSGQHAFLVSLGLLLASCAQHGAPPVADRVPFDQRLSSFQSLHNGVQTEELRAFFAKDASIQSPLTPRPASVEKYLSALKAEPYQLAFGRSFIRCRDARQRAAKLSPERRDASISRNV
jgi:hypothetical protein